MSDELKGKLIEFGFQTIVVALQVACWDMLLHYTLHGGIFRDKSNRASYVEAGDPLFTIATLFLVPFLLVSVYRFFVSLFTLIKTFFQSCFSRDK